MSKSPYDAEGIAKAYLEGAPIKEIQERFGNPHRATVYRLLRSQGIGRQNTIPQTDPATVEKIILLRKEGFSIRKIAEKLDLGARRVQTVIENNGLSQVPIVPENFIYPTKRRNKDGYVLLRLHKDHPYYSMTTSTGEVLEHRLAMAEHLGRPLLPYPNETVHHIDGDKANNTIKNLQLIKGTHRSGQAMCCGDCGSQNIISQQFGVAAA